MRAYCLAFWTFALGYMALLTYFAIRRAGA
jgi:hypothetical protein